MFYWLCCLGKGLSPLKFFFHFLNYYSFQLKLYMVDLKWIWLKLKPKLEIFLYRPCMQKNSKSDPLSDLFPKMTHFFFFVFYLSFSSFPPFETAGMSPLSNTCLRVTGSACLTFFFFLISFSFPPFEMAGLDIWFFFFVFCCFWATYVY